MTRGTAGKRRKGALLTLALALVLSACGGRDPAARAPDAAVAPAPPRPPRATPHLSDAPQRAALLSIARDQNRALASYQTVRAQQEQIYYAAVTQIEEALRRGAPAGSPALTTLWQSAAQALQHLGQALEGLQKILAARPIIAQADTRGIPAAAALLEQLDGAQDELHRQQGLITFEREKMAALQKNIAAGMATPAPLAPAQKAPDTAVENTRAAGRNAAVTQVTAPETAPPEDDRPAATAQTPPLAIIRFNRPNVVFSAQLRDAVEHAQSLTASGHIHLVAVAPHVKSMQDQLLAQAASYQYALSIQRAVEALGIPAQAVRLTTHTSPSATSSEVRIYAEE